MQDSPAGSAPCPGLSTLCSQSIQEPEEVSGKRCPPSLILSSTQRMTEGFLVETSSGLWGGTLGLNSQELRRSRSCSSSPGAEFSLTEAHRVCPVQDALPGWWAPCSAQVISLSEMIRGQVCL